MMTKSTIVCCVSLIVSCSATQLLANEIYSPVTPFTPTAVDKVPPVERVPGKEYTDSLDMNHVPTPHVPRPLQFGLFDGLGGASNGVYAGPFANDMLAEFNIDAQSQLQDTLFREVRDNKVPLVVSTTFDTMLGGDVALAAERADGTVVPFADRVQVVDHGHPGGLLRDIDSVDLWGTEQKTDTNFLSVKGDPFDTSIYSMHLLASGGVQPYLSKSQIADAIGEPNLAPLIDVDALMVRDLGMDNGNPSPFDGTFGPGDAILFSIAPIVTADGNTFFDGGEIWEWDHGSPAQFLSHGGHLWDTAHSVAATLGVNTENIDAIEAVSVPEPSTSNLLCLAMALSFGLVRKR